MKKSLYPNNERGNKALIFGHSLLHTFWNKCQRGKCPKKWPPSRIRKVHAWHVKLMKTRGIKHNSPLVTKQDLSSKRRMKK